jgi:hypothetical protein
MIDFKTEVSFGLGEKVSHEQYGLGQIIGVDFGCLSVMFEDGAVYQFYGDDMPTPTTALLISELRYVGQWVKIDWDDESTLPEFDELVLCVGKEGYVFIGWLFDDEFGNFQNEKYETIYWQPLPKIPSYE